MTNIDDTIPFPFKRNTIIIWVVGFVVLVLLTSIFSVKAMNTMESVMFLHSSSQLLVTILAITMGFTLLGLQFRAQSYTMLAMSRYVKDPVVSGFMATYITLIIFNMVSSNHIFGIDPNIASSYTIIGTALSLCYLVGYIYYIVYQIQPAQIIKLIKKELDNITIQKIMSVDNDSKEFESFHVWEQITLKAVDANNLYMFKNGFNVIMDVLKKHLNECTPNQRECIYEFFYPYISAVVLACVKQHRERFVRIFMDEFKLSSKPLLDNDDYLKSREFMMFHIWQHVINESIINYDFRILRYGILSLECVLKQHLKNSKYHDQTLIIFHRYAMYGIDLAISNMNDQYLLQYIDLASKYNFPKDDNANYSSPLQILETILNYSIKNERLQVFEMGTKMIFQLRSQYSTNEKTKHKLIEIVKRIIINIDERYKEIFLEYFDNNIKSKKLEKFNIDEILSQF